MPKHHTNPGSLAKIWLLIAVAAIGFFAVVWWFTQSPIKLREDHYAITLALYRVCNQRSEVGLNQIESILKSSVSSSDEDDSSLEAIRTIVSEARQSRWTQATQNCRHLLESQVQR